MGVLDDVKNQYPTLAFLLNDPEVGPLLRDAVDPNKGFSPQTFQAKLYQTKWFKGRSTSQRKIDILKNTDPGEYARLRNANLAQVRLMAKKLGLNLTAGQKLYMAEVNLRNGTDLGSEEALYNLMNFAQGQDPKKMGEGSVKGATFDVQEMAREQFYVPLSKTDAYKWGVELALGTKDEKALRAFLSDRAASLYPHLKDQLQGGASMEDLFSGHRAVLARELEMSEASIDFTKQYQKVLHQIDPTTGKPRPMTLHETQTLARQDPKWWKTSNGAEADAGMANFILKAFGKRA